MTSQPSLFPTSKLPKRHAIVYDFLMVGTLTALQAGVEIHATIGCDYCKPDSPCQFAEKNGREVLEALKKKGLLKMDKHHVYRRVDQPGSQMAVLSPEEEFGF